MYSEKIYSPFLWPRASCGSSSVISSRRKEGLSVMTNVSASGPRTTSPRTAAPLSAQSPEGGCPARFHTTLPKLSWDSSCTGHALLHVVLSWEGLGPWTIHGSFKTYKHWTLSWSFHNTGLVWDSVRNADSLVGPHLTLCILTRPPVTHVHVRMLDNATMTPGKSTCLSLEPCCLNQGFCRWLLLPGLLLFQLVLCISAPIREKTLHTNVYALFYLLLDSCFMFRSRQKAGPLWVIIKVAKPSLTCEGLPAFR